MLFSLWVKKTLRNKGSLSEKQNKFVDMETIYELAIFLIIFAMAFGPYLCNLLGYKVSDQGSITNSDAISWVLNPLLTVLVVHITLKTIKD